MPVRWGFIHALRPGVTLAIWTRINLLSNDTMTFSSKNTTSMHSAGEMQMRTGDAQFLIHKDGTACLTGKRLFLDFEEIEINGDKKLS